MVILPWKNRVGPMDKMAVIVRLSVDLAVEMINNLPTTAADKGRSWSTVCLGPWL